MANDLTTFEILLVKGGAFEETWELFQDDAMLISTNLSGKSPRILVKFGAESIEWTVAGGHISVLAPATGYHWVDRPVQYFVRSTVFGGAVLTDVNNTGKKLRTYVRAGGETIAWQTLYHPASGGSFEDVRFEHVDPAGTTRRMSRPDGTVITTGTGLEDSPAEFDPSGGSVGLGNPYPDMNTQWQGEGCIGCGSNGISGIDDNSRIMVNGWFRPCQLDGAEYDCRRLASLNGLGISGPRRNDDASRTYGQWIDEDDPNPPNRDQHNLSGSAVKTTFVPKVFGSKRQNNGHPKSLVDAPKSKYPDADKNLKPKIDKILGDKACKDKLNELMGKLGGKIKDISVLSDKFIQGQEGFKLYMTQEPVYFIQPNKREPAEPANLGEAVGKSITINRSVFGGDLESLIYIHELLHISNSDDHIDIANAIAKLEGIDKEWAKYGKSKEDFMDANSNGLINSWLQNHCVKDGSTKFKPWDEILKTIGAKK